MVPPHFQVNSSKTFSLTGPETSKSFGKGLRCLGASQALSGLKGCEGRG